MQFVNVAVYAVIADVKLIGKPGTAYIYVKRCHMRMTVEPWIY